MRLDYIEKLEKIYKVGKDDFNNELWFCFISTKYKDGHHPFCGYIVISTTIQKWSNGESYDEKAFYKTTVKKSFIDVNYDGFRIKEYLNGTHSLLEKTSGVTTKFYIQKL